MTKSTARSERTIGPKRLPDIAWEVTQADIDGYGALCGATDPMHIDPAFARSGPFGGTIAQGLLIFGRISELFANGPWDPVLWARQSRIEVSFKAPARPGDRLVFEAIRDDSATDAEQTQAGTVPTSTVYEIACRRHDGAVLIAGKAWIADQAP